ncbi:MAG: hemolysin family protein [Bdellovibrionales bacterium]
MKLLSIIKTFFAPKQQDTSLRDAIEEYIEEPDNFALEAMDSESLHERALLSNILALRDISVDRVMVPRADIVAVDSSASTEDLFAVIADSQVSRLPVFKDNLDNVIGTIHLKDILSAQAKGENFIISDNITEIPIISPSMPILDLLLTMRQSRRHMALVVDEYGGIDGLITIGDIVESVLGEIEDEHDTQEDPQLLPADDGSIIADARVSIEHFESEYGTLLSDDERSESDTLGGLVFTIAGRIPVRGEVLTHDSGMEFEIMDADPRRINVMRIRNIPESIAAE